MLEIIGIKFALLHHKVRLNIILKLGNLQLPSMLLKDRLGLCKDFRVRRGRGSNGNGAAVTLRNVSRGSIRRSIGGCIRSFSHTTLHYKVLFIVLTIGIKQRSLVICMEELFISQGSDLIIDPVKKRLISF